MNNTLSAINILIGSKLINKDNVPLLFYFNGGQSIIDDMISNEDFIKYLKDNGVFSLSVSNHDVITASNYFETYIAMFYYNNTQYEQHTFKLEDVYPLHKIDDELREIVTYNTLSTEFNKMYERVMKKPYVMQFQTSSLYEYVRYMYDEIKNAYNERITPTTVINYIRMQLSTQYNGKINADSVTYLVGILTNILKDKT